MAIEEYWIRGPCDGKEEQMTTEEKRKKMVEGLSLLLLRRSRRFTTRLGSLCEICGGALGAAAGVAVGGPVGGVLGAVVGRKAAGKLTSEDGAFIAEGGPSAVGAYPHLRRVGDLVYVSGMGPRQPGTNEIPGGPIKDEGGNPLDYDIRAQTHAVMATSG